MNLIKDKFRSSLETESLNHLMTVKLNGPSLAQFDPTEAIDRWYFSSKTTRHTSDHTSGPRKRHHSESQNASER